MHVLGRLVLHGVEVGAGVFEQRAEDEGEADPQVDVDGLDEAVGVRQGRASPHHQRGHGQDCGDPCITHTCIYIHFFREKKQATLTHSDFLFRLFQQLLNVDMPIKSFY